MGNCAHQGRFSTQRHNDHNQVPNIRFLSPQIEKKYHQIVLKPLQFLSAAKNLKQNTSNTRASTQRPASLVDVIDEYNHETKVLQNLKVKDELNLVLTESYYIEQPINSHRSAALKGRAKIAHNSPFLSPKQNMRLNRQNNPLLFKQKAAQKDPPKAFVKSTVSF